MHRIVAGIALPPSCLFLLAASGLRAGDLTLDWILDRENARALETARPLWLDDETLLLDDPRRPEAERTLERLDPRTLERRPALEATKALESWKTILGPDGAPKHVGLPAAATADGKTLLYERDGDLFLLERETAAVRRVTNTEEAETLPRFSPDGRLLAYVRGNDLYAAETATGRERRLTRDGGAALLNGTLSWVYWEELMDRHDDAYWWSPDATAILYLQTDESPVAPFPIADHEPPTPRVRWQRYPKAGSSNPRVRAGIVGAESCETRWLDLADAGGGAASTAAAGGDTRLPTDEYVVRCGWLPDGKAVWLQMLNRAQNRLRLVRLDRDGGAPRLLLEETAKTWINLHRDLHFLAGAERFLWLSERSGHRHLYLCSAAGGTPAPVTAGDWVVRGGGLQGRWEGSIAWIDAAAGNLLFHAACPGPLETQLYRVRLDGTDLKRITEGDGTHSVFVSPAGSFFVDTCSRSGVPPRLTLHRADGTLLAVLSPAATETLAPFALEPPELFTVAADDGLPLPARLFRPRPLEEGRRYPAIVYIYGGPGSPAIADAWDGKRYLWSQLLARRGFAVFTIDPRSACDRGKSLEDTVHRKFYGEGELKDILAGVRHLKSLPFIDPARVGIWGWSGGGTNTLYAMTHSQEFSAGIAVAGVADQRYYDTVYTERYMGLPSENEEGYRATAVANSAANLHGRLLLVHGTADDNVHAQGAMRLVHELVAAGKQFDLMLYPRRDHGIGDPAAQRHLFRLMLDFWERNLRPSYSF